MIIVKSFEFLSIEREEKPRKCGITMVLDKGMGLETASSLMDISGEYVDYLKFGWGTSIVHEQDIIKAKVEMYKSHEITPYTGGTLFELAYKNDKIYEFFDEAHKLGFPAIEISDGSLVIPREDKLNCIEMAKKDGFEVLSEVGKKNPDLDKELSLDERTTRGRCCASGPPVSCGCGRRRQAMLSSPRRHAADGLSSPSCRGGHGCRPASISS